MIGYFGPTWAVSGSSATAGPCVPGSSVPTARRFRRLSPAPDLSLRPGFRFLTPCPLDLRHLQTSMLGLSRRSTSILECTPFSTMLRCDRCVWRSLFFGHARVRLCPPVSLVREAPKREPELRPQVRPGKETPKHRVRPPVISAALIFQYASIQQNMPQPALLPARRWRWVGILFSPWRQARWPFNLSTASTINQSVPSIPRAGV